MTPPTRLCPGFDRTRRLRPGSGLFFPLAARSRAGHGRPLRIDGGRTLGLDALQYFNDFVEFSLALNKLDGRKIGSRESYRVGADPGYFHYLRADEELTRVLAKASRRGALHPQTELLPFGWTISGVI